jgi:hypothetical protein
MWLLSAAAYAADPVWGAGLHVGTAFLPGAYPIRFPPKIESYDFDKSGQADDVNGDGTLDATTLEKVRGDFAFGFDGYYWLGGSYRLGLTTNFDFGTRYSEVGGVVTFDRTIDLDRAYLLFGGGLGFANTVWRGTDEDERLRLPNYPLRVEAGTVLPVNDWIGLTGTLFAQMGIPSRHDYVDLTGTARDVAGIPPYYTSLGVQVGGIYGRVQ